MLKREYAKASRNVELTAEQEAEAQRLADTVAVKTKDELLQIMRLLVSKKDHELLGETEFHVRDIVHRVGAQAIETALDERKKGAPRVEHDLPALRRGSAVRRLARQRSDLSAGARATTTALLSLRQLRPGTLPLGRDAAYGRLSPDARRARGGELDGHPRKLRQGGGADAA